MKQFIFTVIVFFVGSFVLHAQITWISKTYSQNGEFYIKCIPYDDEPLSARGKSFVYDKNNKLIYTLNRGFNGVRESGNFINISNDGRTIIYAVEVYAKENVDGLKSISI